MPKTVSIGCVFIMLSCMLVMCVQLNKYSKLSTKYLGIHASETGEGVYLAGEECHINTGLDRYPEELYQDFIMCAFHHRQWQEMMTLETGGPNASVVVIFD